VNSSHQFMEPVDSLSCLQDPATHFCPVLVQCSPQTLFL
jgi:hypothetical protein